MIQGLTLLAVSDCQCEQISQNKALSLGMPDSVYPFLYTKLISSYYCSYTVVIIAVGNVKNPVESLLAGQLMICLLNFLFKICTCYSSSTGNCICIFSFIYTINSTSFASKLHSKR